ncbi:MAG: hypothetical protein HDS65_10265 [Bacteroidales bacterium]|nr:hypothetical protein [Bacteroidales bacterium]
MKIKFLLALGCIVLGMNSSKASSVVTDSTASGHNAAVRVMSFNIRFINPNDSLDTSWDSRRESCARVIRFFAPDVVGMQEPREVQKDYFSEMLPEYSRHSINVSDSITEKQTGHGVIYYRNDKYTLLDSGYFWLSETPDVPSAPWNSTDRHYRVAVWVHLLDNETNTDFYTATTHFPYKKDPVDTEVRAKCAALIVEKMKEKAGEDATVFVTGDMNASPKIEDPEAPGTRSLAPFYEWMLAARNTAILTDDNNSFNGFGRVIPGMKGKILDHIFYRNARPIVFETLDRPDFGLRWNSDHFPIMATFTY